MSKIAEEKARERRLHSVDGGAGPPSPVSSPRKHRFSSCSESGGVIIGSSTARGPDSPKNSRFPSQNGAPPAREASLSKVELLSIKGKAVALYWSPETNWEMLSQAKRDGIDKMAKVLCSSLILRASVDVIGVSSCLCVYAYTMPALLDPGVNISTRAPKQEEGWVRIPLFVPFTSMKNEESAEERLTLLVTSLAGVAGMSEDEVAGKLDLIGMKQKDMRTYDVLFSVYTRCYMRRVDKNVDTELLHSGDKNAIF